MRSTSTIKKCKRCGKQIYMGKCLNGTCRNVKKGIRRQ